MKSRCTAIAALVLTIGCGGSDKTPAGTAPQAAKPRAQAVEARPGAKPKKVTPATDPHAIAKAKDRTLPEPPLDASIGTFDLVVDGKTSHMLRIPRGQNRAVVVPDRGIARVSVAAAEGHAGWPHARLVLENLRLDTIGYPLTIPSKHADAKNVSVTLKYQVNENRIYISDEAKGGNVSVTLDAFEGSRLRGSFEGALFPTAAGLGDEPLPVSGTFAIELGLKGVEPGPVPEGAPPPVRSPLPHR